MPPITEQALARTYSHPSVADPWKIVEQYRDAMRFGPNTGSTAVANKLEVPRGRVRPWLDGAKPDAVHALDIASEHGWFDATPRNDLGEAFATLVIGVFASGSLAHDTFQPSWVGSDKTIAELEAALDTLGLGSRFAHVDNDRPTELFVTDHSSVLGRTLSVLGAPQGDKNSVSVSGLPDWLFEVPVLRRATAVRLVIRERGTRYDDKATIQLQARDRTQGFRDDLARFIGELTSEPVNARSNNVIITAAAARDLGVAE